MLLYHTDLQNIICFSSCVECTEKVQYSFPISFELYDNNDLGKIGEKLVALIERVESIVPSAQ